jgi:LEA14-like dessication related protein
MERIFTFTVEVSIYCSIKKYQKIWGNENTNTERIKKDMQLKFYWITEVLELMCDL